MSREIKFRAKVNGGYVYSDSYVNLAFYFDATKSYEQEQFTGLKDKKGREIYEGDITDSGEVIVFEDGIFGTTYKNNLQGVSRLSEKRCMYFEIIGNIYENPELL